MNNLLSSAETMLAVMPLSESSEELLNKLEKKELYLPSLRQMATENRKREWLAVRVLLKNLLKEEKSIAYLPSGKPYLTDRSFQLSISHTKGFVAVGLHPSLPIGIDIEYLSPRVKKIRGKFLSEAEEQHICAEQEEVHLLLHWSAKESLFKVLGEEKVDFRECLHVCPFVPLLHEQASFEAIETRTPDKRKFRVDYRTTGEFVVTAVVDEGFR